MKRDSMTNNNNNNSNNNTKYTQVVQHKRGDSSNNYKLQTQDGSHSMYPRYSQTHSMTSGLYQYQVKIMQVFYLSRFN